MAVSSSRDPNWAACLFSDAGKMASILDDLKELVLQHVEDEDTPTQIAGVDSLAEWYTDILGAALAVKLGTGYLSLKQFPAQEGQVEAKGESSSQPSSARSTPSSSSASSSSVVVERYSDGGNLWFISVDTALVRDSVVLLCCTFIDRLEPVDAARRLLVQAGARVVGCVALRYDESCSQALAATIPIIARSRTTLPRGPSPLKLPSSPIPPISSSQPAAPKASKQRVTRASSSSSSPGPPEAGNDHAATAAKGGGESQGRSRSAATANGSKRRRLAHGGSRDASPVQNSSGDSRPADAPATAGLSPLKPTLSTRHWTFKVEANDPGEDREDHEEKSEEGLFVYAVLDGHGGSLASEFASENLIPLALEALRPDMTDDQVAEALKRAFLTCDDHFISSLDANVTLEQARGFWNAGSCAILALIRGHTLFVAHVGDCRAVLVSSNQPPPHHPPPADPADSMSSTPPDSSTSDSHRSSPSSPARRKSPRRQPPRGPPPAPVAATALSEDHSCKNTKEVEAVRQRSKDPNAIRYSSRDAAAVSNMRGHGAIARVAGSLAVTRALGDAYLKRKNLSFEPFKPHVPYITAEPEVSYRELDPSRDRYLIIATDGLWERVSNQEAATVVHDFFERQQAKSAGGESRGSSSTAVAGDPSAALVEAVLSNVATTTESSLADIKKLRRGYARRCMHDDVLVTVVALDFQPPVLVPPAAMS